MATRFNPPEKQYRAPTVGYLYGNKEDMVTVGYFEVGGKRYDIGAVETVDRDNKDVLEVSFVDHTRWVSPHRNLFYQKGKSTFTGYMYYPEDVAGIEDHLGWTYSFYFNRGGDFLGHKRIAFTIKKLRCRSSM